MKNGIEGGFSKPKVETKPEDKNTIEVITKINGEEKQIEISKESYDLSKKNGNLDKYKPTDSNYEESVYEKFPKNKFTRTAERDFSVGYSAEEYKRLVERYKVHQIAKDIELTDEGLIVKFDNYEKITHGAYDDYSESLYFNKGISLGRLYGNIKINWLDDNTILIPKWEIEKLEKLDNVYKQGVNFIRKSSLVGELPRSGYGANIEDWLEFVDEDGKLKTDEIEVFEEYGKLNLRKK